MKHKYGEFRHHRLYMVWNTARTKFGTDCMCDRWQDFINFYNDLLSEYDSIVDEGFTPRFIRIKKHLKYSKTNYCFKKNRILNKDKRESAKVKVKCYADYIDDAVRKGDMKESDAAYYKRLNSVGKTTGVGVSNNKVWL